MAGKVLSIEIGTQTTRVVEMDYRIKNPKIYHFFSIPTPEDAIADGSVRLVPEFVEQIKNQLIQYKIKTKKVIFVMNSTRIANRDVVIPMVKEKQIHPLLITNSAEFFPVDLTQYQLVHNIVEKNEEEKQYKLNVLAVPNEIISSYRAFAQALNLEIEALDYMGNSIVQGMIRLMDAPVKVVIKVDEISSMLTILRNDKLELQRNISYGISEAVDRVMESTVYGRTENFSEGLAVLRKHPCILSRLEEKQGEQQLAEDVTESVRALVGNIGRILDYYTSRNQDSAIRQIWLIGIGADCQGLRELLSNELNVSVQVMTELPDMISNRSTIQEGFWAGEYVAPIAGTLYPLNFELGEKNEKKIRPGSEMFIPGLVCGVGVGLSVVLLVSSLLSSLILNGQRQKLNEQIEALQEAEDIYQEYEQVLGEYSKLQEMYQLTDTPNDMFLTFLGEMEENMPSDMVVEKMTAGKDGISMDIQVSDKTVAAEVLMQLREFSTVSVVSTSELAEQLDDAGKSRVTFTVSCQYAAPLESDVKEGGAEDENQ